MKRIIAIILLAACLMMCCATAFASSNLTLMVRYRTKMLLQDGTTVEVKKGKTVTGRFGTGSWSGWFGVVDDSNTIIGLIDASALTSDPHTNLNKKITMVHACSIRDYPSVSGNKIGEAYTGESYGLYGVYNGWGIIGNIKCVYMGYAKVK